MRQYVICAVYKNTHSCIHLRNDVEVNKKGNGTRCDAYLDQHVSYWVHFWTFLSYYWCSFFPGSCPLPDHKMLIFSSTLHYDVDSSSNTDLNNCDYFICKRSDIEKHLTNKKLQHLSWTSYAWNLLTCNFCNCCNYCNLVFMQFLTW